MIECLTCGKTFDDEIGSVDAHVREHFEIENMARRSGYFRGTDFPIQLRRRTEVLDK